jgi:hypothetical protein
MGAAYRGIDLSTTSVGARMPPLIFHCRRTTKEAKHTKIGRALDDPVISSINFRVIRIFVIHLELMAWLPRLWA